MANYVTIKSIKKKDTAFLVWFAQNAYHILVNRRSEAIKELNRRGIDTSQYGWYCRCKSRTCPGRVIEPKS